MKDSKIVDLYLARNESAIVWTSKKYGKKIRNLANRLLQDRQEAEECENDTYLVTWNSIPPHEPRTYLFAFLGKIVRHLAIDLCRKKQDRKRIVVYCELTREMAECIPGRSDVEGDVDANALIKSINAYLGTCSADRRNIFVRRYWFFDSISEICRRYNYSQSKVKSLLFRTREDLKAYLEKEGYVI